MWTQITQSIYIYMKHGIKWKLLRGHSPYNQNYFPNRHLEQPNQIYGTGKATMERTNYKHDIFEVSEIQQLNSGDVKFAKRDHVIYSSDEEEGANHSLGLGC